MLDGNQTKLYCIMLSRLAVGELVWAQFELVVLNPVLYRYWTLILSDKGMLKFVFILNEASKYEKLLGKRLLLKIRNEVCSQKTEILSF